MARTPPRLADAHPALARGIVELAERYAEAYPSRALSIIWVHRSPEEQNRAFEKGYSKVDGKNSFSRHNFLPSLAADVWVYGVEEQPDGGLFEGRPGRDQGASLILRRGDLGLNSKEVWREYEQMGEIAAQITGITKPLFWGGHWARIKDGPHIEVHARDRVLELQRVLRDLGSSPGELDGLWGSNTRRAYEDVCEHFGFTKKKVGGSFPCHPDVWKRMWEELNSVV